MIKADICLGWIRKNREKAAIVVMWGIFPFILCLLYCAAEGISLNDIFLPSSYWNDELYYYKQVEGILGNGLPRGYFGFNESSGIYLSFAAWSPVLLAVWCVWGLLFGWNYLSPVICNLICVMFAMAVFALVAKRCRRQSAVIFILLALFKPFPRFILSGMPEAVC